MKAISKNIPKNLKMTWLSENWSCNTSALNLFLEGCEKRLTSKPLLFLFVIEHINMMKLLRDIFLKMFWPIIEKNFYVLILAKMKILLGNQL
jgi:hypothetical protein